MDIQQSLSGKVIKSPKGYNTYVKIDDDNCQKAIKWWPKRRATWRVIQRAWLDSYGELSQVTFKENHWGMPLWIRLFCLARQSVKTSKKEQRVYKEAMKRIRRYRVKDK